VLNFWNTFRTLGYRDSIVSPVSVGNLCTPCRWHSWWHQLLALYRNQRSQCAIHFNKLQ